MRSKCSIKVTARIGAERAQQRVVVWCGLFKEQGNERKNGNNDEVGGQRGRERERQGQGGAFER